MAARVQLGQQFVEDDKFPRRGHERLSRALLDAGAGLDGLAVPQTLGVLAGLAPADHFPLRLRLRGDQVRVVAHLAQTHH